MRTNKLFWTSAVIAGCFVITSCDSSEDIKSNIEKKEIQLDAKTRAAADNLQDYYVNITCDFAGYNDSINSKNNDSERGTVILSPVSISMALSMFANGVDNNLKNEILNYLGTSDLQNLNTFNRILLKELPIADWKSCLELNNALWYHKDYTLTSAYENLMEEYYNAFMKKTDFGGDSKLAADEINSWANKATHGLIKEITSEEQLNLTLAFLVNTMYFKSPWSFQLFDTKNTKPYVFHAFNGKEQNVMMMRSDLEELDYVYYMDYQYVSVEYGNGAYRLELLLPNKNLSLDESRIALTGDVLRELRKRSQKRRVYLNLPKLKCDNKYDLTDVMDFMGFKHHRKTDLSMFTNEKESQVNYEHFTSFEMSEEGTEAAAVTTINAMTTGVLPPSYPDLYFDRPFFFFITEFSTGVCILSGRIADIPKGN